MKAVTNERIKNITLALLASTIGLGLVVGLLNASRQPGVAEQVLSMQTHLKLEQPVTAVLLAFRGYDTLLEIAVLVMAVIAVLILVPPRKARAAAPITAGPAPSPLMLWLLPRLLPVLVLIAGYLWWAGSSRPGGAFQAGTLVGAAAVIVLLSQQMRPPRLGRIWRAILVLGLLCFLAVGLLGLLWGQVFLQYPDSWAKALIMLIELTLSLSIGLCFMLLVLGVPPRRRDRFPGERS